MPVFLYFKVVKFIVSYTVDYCSLEIFQPTCSKGDVIVMSQAWYGRMRLGNCVKTDFGHLGCAANVLQQLDTKCSGNMTCKVHVYDHLHRNVDLQCPAELSGYLEAKSECLSGKHEVNMQCTYASYAIQYLSTNHLLDIQI